MYIPNPIRCRKCLRFGHFADNCSKEAICGFCTKPKHDGSPCTTFVPTCINCRGNHTSLDIKCPRFVEEKCIKTLQFREKIPYNIAKRMFRESSSMVTSKSFAAMVRSKKSVDATCQTEDCKIQPAVVRSTASSTLPIASATPVSTPLSAPIPPSPLPSPLSLKLPSVPSSPLAIPSISPITPLSPPTQGVKDGDKILNESPPLPRRNSLETVSRKYNKNKNTNLKSGEEMDTTLLANDK